MLDLMLVLVAGAVAFVAPLLSITLEPAGVIAAALPYVLAVLLWVGVLLRQFRH